MTLGNTNLVVKRTFIEVVDDGPTDDMYMQRGRACSDSAVDMAKKMSNRDEDCCADFELTGLSDAETISDTDVSPVTPQLPCYNFVRQDSLALSVSQGPCNGREEEQASTLSGKASDRGSSEASTTQSLAALLAENARLATENQLLKENSRLSQENAALRSGPSTPPATAQPTLQPTAQFQCAGRPGQFHGAADASYWTTQACYPMPMQAAYYPMPVPWADPSMGYGAGNWANEPRSSRRSRRQQGGAVTGAASACAGLSSELPEDERTTVMLRNLPNNYTRAMVLNLLDNEGFKGKYDFFYLPIDFKTNACLGYAFINLTCSSMVPGFWKVFEGFSRWALPSRKVCGVTWSGPHQGLQAHVDRYRNSPVMHPSVPEECRPLIFADGQRVPFVAPCKEPKAPRLRNFVEDKQ
mmetsp:Transcript_70764/g.185513  ORF Transcript_70764/g.185513 Transcript_70764/m.185513 type:complete len:412 (+) Transcript_70764:75-1310(+)